MELNLALRAPRTARVLMSFCGFGTCLAGAQTAAPADTAAASAPSVAASGPAQLKPVIVTAERRAEDAKSVPVSASILGGDLLDALNSGGQDMQMLAARAPSLQVESSDGRAFPRFYLRGYGNVDFHQNASQPVSLVYDDVVQESPVLKGFPAFDLEQVEVLRGPQGSLFGRNTPAGVVKFDSVKPQHNSDGYLSLSEATRNTASLEGAANVLLSGDWAMRVSLIGQHRDNWVDNGHTGQKDQYGGYNDGATRVQLSYQPQHDFSALLNVHARSMSGSASLFRANTIVRGTDGLSSNFHLGEIDTDGENHQHLETYGSNLRLRWDLGAVTLHSITGIESVHFFTRGDVDGGYGSASSLPSGPGTPISFAIESADGTSGHHQFTQEFRVESNTVRPLHWQAGLYYFNEGYTVGSYSYNTLGGGALSSLISSKQRNVAWAAFGSAKYTVDDDWDLRAGLRYTHDRKDFVTNPNDLAAGGSDLVTTQGLSAHPSDSKLNWDLSTVYKLTSETNVYARAATGFRGTTIQAAGPYNPQSVALPETTVSYEAGVKSDLFDKRARVSFDVYRYDVKNQQLSVNGGTSNSTLLVNAKKTVGQGAEFELEAQLAEPLLVTLGGSYNQTVIHDPTLSVATCASYCTVLSPLNSIGNALIDGNSLPESPKWVANMTARYGVPVANGEAFVYTDWSYRSKINFLLYNTAEYIGRPLLLGGLRLGYNWDHGRYEASLFGRNITNRIQLVGGLSINNLAGFVNDYNPRTLGAQFTVRF